jgi:hypothetical protein
MKIKAFVKGFLIIFGIALLANILITLLWNYFYKDKGPVIDWETSVRMALLFAIIIPLSQVRFK